MPQTQPFEVAAQYIETAIHRGYIPHIAWRPQPFRNRAHARPDAVIQVLRCRVLGPFRSLSAEDVPRVIRVQRGAFLVERINGIMHCCRFHKIQVPS